MNQYSYLAHIGKGHDDNPPGRGSGRYPFGSGKRPFQGISYNNQKIKKKNDYQQDDIIFISGKVRFDEPISKEIKNELDNIIEANAKIIIGDAPGADKRVQDYLAEKKYKNVEVYTTDDAVRNNVGNWKVNKISSEGYKSERQIRSQKDIAMANRSTKGIAIVSEEDMKNESKETGYSATTKNIQRMASTGKPMQLYDYNKNTFRALNLDIKENTEKIKEKIDKYAKKINFGVFLSNYTNGDLDYARRMVYTLLDQAGLELQYLYSNSNKDDKDIINLLEELLENQYKK